jgi:hypothetical protein
MYRCQLFKKTVCAKQNDSENSKKAMVEKSTNQGLSQDLLSLDSMI